MVDGSAPVMGLTTTFQVVSDVVQRRSISKFPLMTLTTTVRRSLSVRRMQARGLTADPRSLVPPCRVQSTWVWNFRIQGVIYPIQIHVYNIYSSFPPVPIVHFFCTCHERQNPQTLSTGILSSLCTSQHQVPIHCPRLSEHHRHIGPLTGVI